MKIIRNVYSTVTERYYVSELRKSQAEARALKARAIRYTEQTVFNWAPEGPTSQPPWAEEQQEHVRAFQSPAYRQQLV